MSELKTTIRFHVGGFDKIKPEHNRRDKDWVKHEKHIREDGESLIILDRDLEEVYQELFGEAIKEYNEKQKRKDRKIDGVKGYMESILNNKQGNKNRKTGKAGKDLAKEVIIGVGSLKPLKDRDGNFKRDKAGNIIRPYKIPDKIAKEVLLEYAGEFMLNNPNLKTYGIYYHNDEDGAPHLHLDFVPFATGYKRGMQVQNSMSKALSLQGIKGQSNRLNSYVLWQEQQREIIKEKLNARGIEIERPDAGKNKEEEDWRIYKKKRKLEEEVDNLKREKEDYQIIDYIKDDPDFYANFKYMLKRGNDTFKKIKRKELNDVLEDDMGILIKQKRISNNYSK